MKRFFIIADTPKKDGILRVVVLLILAVVTFSFSQ